MLSPLLIIGVGGAGGKTIRAMKQELNRILESSGHTEGIPAAWQFLQIDTTRDGVDFPAPILPADEFHCVVPSGAGYADVLANVTRRGSLSEQQSMLAGWVIPQSAVAINFGAGAIRATGRIVSVADSDKTLRSIQGAISKMASPTALLELATVSKKFGALNPGSVPQVFIISSLVGGTGAGMFMDVAELLKRATSQSWAQESISFLYTPEVFKSLGTMASNVSKNMLGVMNELIASQWVGISERSELLYSKMGLAAGNSSGMESFGSKTNILIGTRNSVADISIGASSEGMDAVFVAVGEALAVAISNDEISDFLLKNFAYRSWSHGTLDVSGLAPEKFQGLTGVSNIGFGKLTLGADRILDYVADALTRRQIEILLWPDLIPALLRDGATGVGLIQIRSDQVWPIFLVASGLDIRGPRNQIIEALIPSKLDELIKQWVHGIIQKSVSSKSIPLALFSKAIWSEWMTETDAFLRSLKDQMDIKAQKWVPEIQTQMQELIARQLVLNGYPVITDLVERLKVELKEQVVPELIREHTEFANAVIGFDERIFYAKVNEIADGLIGVSNQNGALLGKLSSLLSRVIEYQAKSYVNDLASNLVRDMLSLFIDPLIEQLSDARIELGVSLSSSVTPMGATNPYPHFPVWGSGVVPHRYKGRALERVLIDPSSYETTYEFFAGNDTQGGPAFQMSVDAALVGKKLNQSPGLAYLQTLITHTSPWVTSVREAQGAMYARASKLEWTFHTEITELSDRNRRWLKDEESTFGKFTNMSIRSYVSAVGESPQIRARREGDFVREFQALLKISQPLTLLNPNGMQHILTSHGGNAEGTLLRSNKIPFDVSSPVGQQCISILQQNGFDPRNPSFEHEWFDPGSNASNMSVVSSTQASLPAWAFASLTDPILEQVAQSKIHVGTWAQFWNGRRTRPLTECIPFETEIRRSMITGWFVVRLFGMGKVSRVPTGRTVQIWNPTLETPDWSTFPSPLLNSHHEDLSRDTWVLPQLLVSAGIALAEFGKSGNPEFINGYRLLKFLGREVTTSFNYRDHWDGHGAGDLLPRGERSQSNYLKNWVESGESPYQNGALVTPLQVSLALTPDRAEALIKTVQLIRSEYNAIWMKFSESPWHSLPETWELKEDIDQALSDIADYISQLPSSPPSTIA
jgi:hypothetical protein